MQDFVQGLLLRSEGVFSTIPPKVFYDDFKSTKMRSRLLYGGLNVCSLLPEEWKNSNEN